MRNNGPLISQSDYSICYKCILRRINLFVTIWGGPADHWQGIWKYIISMDNYCREWACEMEPTHGQISNVTGRN